MDHEQGLRLPTLTWAQTASCLTGSLRPSPNRRAAEVRAPWLSKMLAGFRPSHGGLDGAMGGGV